MVKSLSDMSVKEFNKSIKGLLDFYQESLEWVTVPNSFSMPALDYLVFLGFQKEDVEDHVEEILDAMQGEEIENLYREIGMLIWKK